MLVSILMHISFQDNSWQKQGIAKIFKGPEKDPFWKKFCKSFIIFIPEISTIKSILNFQNIYLL